MKQKPAVKNELFLENILTLHHEDKGATLRVAMDNFGLVKMEVHEPTDKDFRDVLLLFADDDMKKLFELWREWREEDAN